MTRSDFTEKELKEMFLKHSRKIDPGSNLQILDFNDFLRLITELESSQKNENKTN